MNRAKIRVVALTAAVVLMVCLCGFRLIEYQIVNGDKYLESAQTKTESEVRVNAARGKIVDRYGEELVTNKVGFSVVFNRSFLKAGTENSTIRDMIQIMEGQNEEWVDELPISTTEPYSFLPGKDSEVESTKKLLGMQTYATADECMAEIIKRFELEEHSAEDARKIGGVRYGMLAKDFSIYNQYTFAEDISPATRSIIDERGYRYPGVQCFETAIREYGEGDILPYVIGSMSAIFPDEVEKYKEKGYSLNEQVGRTGIEAVMEEQLRGVPGTILVEQSNTGAHNPVATEVKSPVAGNSVVLTIDKEFQVMVQDILENYIKRLQGSSGLGRGVTAGAVVVLDTSNGDVLATATYPTYSMSEVNDPVRNAELENDPLKPKLNRAFREIYRPGSTFKTVTAAAALLEGTIDEHSTVLCTGRYMFDTSANPYQPTCTGVHGNTAVINSLKMSCNIFFYDVGRRLGITKLGEYAKKFGLGTETGLEIGNAEGVVASPEYSEQLGQTWYQGNTWQAAIGQSDTKVTPLQMAIQAMTIANKGTRYASHIVKSVNSYDLSEVIEEKQPEILSDLSGNDAVFDLVQEGMRQAANRRASLVNIEGGVAIKTGTPQVTTTQTNSTTVGFYPAQTTPEISFAIVLENGEYSADMMAEVIEAYNYLKAVRAGLIDPSDSSDSSQDSSASSDSGSSQSSSQSSSSSSQSDPAGQPRTSRPEDE